MRQGKGGGYTKWAIVYNIKQMAQTLLFLQERDIWEYEVLTENASGASAHFYELSQEIKATEKRQGEIAVLKTHILNYVKARDVFVEYKKSGYSKTFYAEHESELVLNREAKEVFDQLPEKKIPEIKDLDVEYAEILKHKKELYSEYTYFEIEPAQIENDKEVIHVKILDHSIVFLLVETTGSLLKKF